MSYSYYKVLLDQLYSISSIRIISLKFLGNYIQKLTSHVAICGSPTQLIGESRRTGLSSV